jgi:hypothetical protein
MELASVCVLLSRTQMEGAAAVVEIEEATHVDGLQFTVP